MNGSPLTPPVTGHDHAQGLDTAPVTLVEYGDFECPYCGEAYGVVKTVQRQLGDELRFVFRNFPLTEAHPYAEHAAEAAEAAGAQGQFWPMHDLLYEHQDALRDQDLAQYARELGLDGRAVLAEIEGEAFRERVRADFMSGVRSGVNGTPTFFINGRRFDGAWRDPRALAGALRRATHDGAEA